MLRNTLVRIGIAAALGVVSGPLIATPAIQNRAVDIVGTGGVADPLIAVEANRVAIVSRLVADHSNALAASGIAPAAFRAALMSLRADQLLAASLVSTLAEVTTIVAEPPASGAALQRFVALTPTVPTSMAELPVAEAYLVRDGESLSVVKAQDLQLGSTGGVLVGYFAPATTTVTYASATTSTTYAPSTVERFAPKDGPGSGAGSYLACTFCGNVASGTNSAVVAGSANSAVGPNSFVGAGQSNLASGTSATVLAGFDNQATVIDSTIVGGAGNRATGARSVIVGGGYNRASGQWSFIGGGGRQTANAGGAGSFIEDNVAAGDFSGVVAGQGNRASGIRAFVGGGTYNIASGHAASILGGNNGVLGQGNTASGDNAAIGGGWGNFASGDSATVPGGNNNVASGIGSVAMGINARTEAPGPVPHDGAFVFSDGSSGIFRSMGAHTFNVLATAGARVVTAATNTAGEAVPTAGVTIGAGGGSWTSLSDRAAKRDLLATDPKSVLRKVMAMPIYTWRYITEISGANHMGPMAQDFHSAFGLGDSDRTITNVDADGVALAAIQGLKQELDAKNARIDRLEREVSSVRSLKRELRAIKEKLGLQ